MSGEVQKTQWEGDGIKRGIGGRDCFVINLDGVPLMLGREKEGIRFFYNSVSNKTGHSFVVPIDKFYHLVEWLKSWDYI